MSKNLFTIPKLTYYAQIFQLDGIIDIQLSPTFSCLFYLLESILKFSIYLVQIEFPPYRGRKRERGELLLLTINSGSFVPFSFASKSFPKKVSVNQLAPRVFKKKKKKTLPSYIDSRYHNYVVSWSRETLTVCISPLLDRRIDRLTNFTKESGMKGWKKKGERETEKDLFIRARYRHDLSPRLRGERRRGIIVGPSVNKVIPPPSRHPFHSVPRYLDPSLPGLLALPFRFLVHIHTRLSVEERFVGIKRYFSAPPRLVATFRPWNSNNRANKPVSR